MQKKRNVSAGGLGVSDEQFQNSDAGNNASEKAPVRNQRNFKKTKSSETGGHAKVRNFVFLVTPQITSCMSKSLSIFYFLFLMFFQFLY